MDHRISLKWVTVLLVACLPLVSGCSGTLATLGDDRSRSQTVTDNEIVLNINKRLLTETNRDLFFNVTTDVFEGRVMLTGTVKKEADRQRAAKLVSGLPGVRTLYNDIQLATDGGIGASANAAWIDAKVRAQLVSAKNVKLLNYRLRVVNSTVFLLGRARNAAEKGEGMRIVRQTSRVRGIVDHVTEG